LSWVELERLSDIENDLDVGTGDICQDCSELKVFFCEA